MVSKLPTAGSAVSRSAQLGAANDWTQGLCLSNEHKMGCMAGRTTIPNHCHNPSVGDPIHSMSGCLLWFFKQLEVMVVYLLWFAAFNVLQTEEPQFVGCLLSPMNRLRDRHPQPHGPAIHGLTEAAAW